MSLSRELPSRAPRLPTTDPCASAAAAAPSSPSPIPATPSLHHRELANNLQCTHRRTGSPAPPRSRARTLPHRLSLPHPTSRLTWADGSEASSQHCPPTTHTHQPTSTQTRKRRRRRDTLPLTPPPPSPNASKPRARTTPRARPPCAKQKFTAAVVGPKSQRSGSGNAWSRRPRRLTPPSGPAPRARLAGGT